MSASAELQKLVFDTIEGNTELMADLGGVYDRVPSDPFRSKTAYVSFGPSDVADDGSECIAAGNHSFQLDVWSKAVGQIEAKSIVDRLHKLFHEAELILVDNALVGVTVGFRRVFPDRDPLLTHGVVSLSARIEEQ